MESLLISLVSVALVIIASVTMMMGAFGSASKITDSWRQMEQRVEQIRRTDITAVPPENYGGGNIDLMVINNGQTDLSDFSQWDIIAQYQDGGIYYIDYTDNASPGNNQWRVEGIYLSSNTSAPELFNFNILNPGETANLTINLNPEISAGESGKLTISTSNGVTSQSIVTRP